MKLKRPDGIALMGAAASLAWAAWLLQQQGLSPLQSWPMRIMALILILGSANSYLRRKKIAIPVGLVCGFAASLLIISEFPGETGTFVVTLWMALKASAFFLCVTLACLLQLKTWTPSNDVPIHLAKTPPPAVIEKVIEAPLAVAPTLPPKAEPIPPSTRDLAIEELVHMLEDFNFSRNKSAWSRLRAMEIANVICQLFPDNDELMNLAGDLAQYRPHGGLDRHSYPAMKPKVAYALDLLRTPTPEPTFLPSKR